MADGVDLCGPGESGRAVVMRVAVAGGLRLNPGDCVRVPEAQAREWVGRGLARPAVDAAEAAIVAPSERAMRPRPRGRG